ncbi:SDR family NAD(P)-dependent oxidoreductase [Catenovulum maritimum]|uniref:Short-chain dehydrogenase n=1 Tax=Catenovulum maritimum TaxID=1513271 RepID=A0A0J8GRF4_9ALTE|nr:SDR family NAD(P)-dependent oxidoreductase [Catenovulum maritimum]KMT65282.1 hypothetical protein XM47_09615 [Catenovulum maritimum]
MQKWVLITGADRGMGLAFVEHYLSLGNQVIATSRREPFGRSLGELKLKYRDQLIVHLVDLADENSIKQFTDKLTARQIKLDLVINNAGISQLQNIGQWDTGTFIQHFIVNSIAPALVSQAVIPLMSSGSKLVQISSGVASLELNIAADAGLDAYAASKAALNTISRRLATKVAKQNIIVTLINPGWVQTDMGGDEAPMSIEQAVQLMTKSIEKLTQAQSGQFIEADGSLIPW